MSEAPLDERRVAAARTQSFFREVNQRIAELARAAEAAKPRFVCECLHVDCAETISLTLEHYATIRRDPAGFLVAPGHEVADVEDVVEHTRNFVVVRKLGVGAQTAAALHGVEDSR